MLKFKLGCYSLIHWPHRVDASWHTTGCNRNREAGSSDRPQKIEKSCVGSELLHHVHTMACSSSWPLIDYLVPNDNGSIEGPTRAVGQITFLVISLCLPLILWTTETHLHSQMVFKTTAS